jgi:glycosyltransferase involved in cell wall biosynthesis
LKILQIINSLQTGGAEKLLLDIIPIMNKKEGFFVDIALLNSNDSPFLNELEKKIDISQIHKISKGSIYNPFLILKILKYYKQYDLIHVHLFPSLYWVSIGKMLTNKKVKLVFTEHNTKNKRLNNKLFRIFDKFIYGFYDKIICISEPVKDALISSNIVNLNKLIVIENGISMDLIKKAEISNRKLLGYSDSDILMIMVAGFRKQKDQDTVIKSLKNLPANHILLLVGDGERREDLKQLVERENLTERVNFLGIRTDVYPLIKMCDISILSSHWEGFGLSAVESMACETPLIVSDVEGLSEVVGDGALLFERGNENELVGLITKLLNDQELKQRQIINAKKRAHLFDNSIMVNKYLELYENILK